jgi:type VI secretion system protein ImpG
MDRRLLHYYNLELQHLREVGAEFAKEHPKVAARLGMEGLEVADPYVERLLEGFSFLAARVQMKMDAEFPRLTQHLLQTVFPGYLAPVPSMVVVRFEPETAEGSLADGVAVARGSALRSVLGKGEQTPCEYRTAHAVTMWPIEIKEARYLRFSGSAVGADLPALPEIRSGKVKAGIRLKLRMTTGTRFSDLALDTLALHLTGSETTPLRVHEQLVANAVAVVAQAPEGAGPAAPSRPGDSRAPRIVHVQGREAIRSMGFGDDEALLPATNRGFSGYRLLQEYFAMPQRFLFVELRGLAKAVRGCKGPELDIIVLFDRVDPTLDGALDATNFTLFATPAINLFPRRGDRIHLSDSEYEYHVLADRTRPADYEVYDVLEVAGYSEGGERSRTFEPFYTVRDNPAEEGGAYFSLRRTPRLLSEREGAQGPRSGYLGSNVYLSIVDARESPFRPDLRQLAVDTLCTNRDLPLMMSIGSGKTDFTLVSGAPVRRIRVITGPTRPRPALGEGETAWRLIGQLSLHHLSLVDTDAKQGAAALRELLTLYGDLAEPAVRKQIEGVRSIAHKPALRRVTRGAATSWVRGLEITITFDEIAFQGTGIVLLGAVLERFFARYVTLNSFTETVVRSLDRGEVARWPATIGNRPLV